MAAATAGHLEAIDALLALGADIDHENKDGQTALMQCAAGSDQAFFRNLLQFQFQIPRHSAHNGPKYCRNAQIHAEKRQYKLLKRYKVAIS